MRQGAKYKGRPLNGIWATAPYLHNGSVPNLDCLAPARGQEAQELQHRRSHVRPRACRIPDGRSRISRFNVNNPDGTPIPGNSNAGHEFGANLSDVERGAACRVLEDALKFKNRACNPPSSRRRP